MKDYIVSQWGGHICITLKAKTSVGGQPQASVPFVLVRSTNEMGGLCKKACQIKRGSICSGDLLGNRGAAESNYTYV